MSLLSKSVMNGWDWRWYFGRSTHHGGTFLEKKLNLCKYQIINLFKFLQIGWNHTSNRCTLVETVIMHLQ